MDISSSRKHAVAIILSIVFGFACALHVIAASRAATSQAVTDAIVRGTVRSVDGTPATRVAVSAAPVAQNTQARSAENAPVSVRVLTDAEGKYEFAGLIPGRYSVSAGAGIPSGATAAGVLDLPSGAVLTVDFTIPPPAPGSRVLKGKMTLNPESAGKPLPPRLTFGPSTVATHADGTLTALIPSGMRRITVRAPAGYFVDSVTVGATVVYSARELQRTPNPMSFSIAVPLEPQPTPEFVITLGTVSTPR
jgi:hypothetical protein